MSKTRSQTNKYLYGAVEGNKEKKHEFVPTYAFPLPIQLPTGKDVLCRLLGEHETKSADVCPARVVADELISRWIHCTILPLDICTVEKKVEKLKTEFYR